MLSLTKKLGSAAGQIVARLRALPGPGIPPWRRRVPVLLQMASVECGAACLAMILGYHGRSTRVSECRDRCGVGRDGLTAKTIAEAARAYGLRVRAFSLELDDLARVSLPAIAHWNFDHFVVVERWAPDRVDIVDPGEGRRQVDRKEFDASFTGVVMTFEPGSDFRRRGSSRPSWHAYLGWMLLGRGTPSVMVQVLAASVLLQLFGLAIPVATKLLIDDILPLRAVDLLTVLGIGLGLLGLSLLVTTYLRTALLLQLQARLDSQMMTGFLEHLLALPFRFFQQRSSGDLLMRLGSNTMIREVLTSQTISTVLDGGLVVGYVAILLALEPTFGLVVLGLGLLQIVLLVVTAPRIHSLMSRELSAQAESESYLVEALSGVRTLKATGTEDRALHQWSNLFIRHLNLSLRRGQLRGAIDTALVTLRTCSPLALLWLGAVQVLEGRMTLGTMLAMTALAASVLTPLASLVASGQRLQLVGAHLGRLTDILEAEPEQDLEQVRAAPRLRGRVELRDVSFRYDPNAPEVLRGISAIIEPGQKVALVGRTGAGKTTLAMVLLGLHRPTEGSVFFDGIPLEQMSYRSVRSQIGVVLQDQSLFRGTIRQNISFNDPAVTPEQVVRAARIAVIQEEIAQMPMGYETQIAERGTGLSGGQRQRIALARAVVHQPVLLLLDEASSHLDVVTESKVEEQLRGLSCTRVVIAHRLSTIRDADVILVLDRGAVVESGSHEELLARSGIYAALLEAPFEPIG